MMTEGSGETAMWSSGRWTHAHKKKFVSLNLLNLFPKIEPAFPNARETAQSACASEVSIQAI